MINPNLRNMDPTKFIIRGIHLDLTETLQRTVLNKAASLFRHNEPIERIRIDLEIDRTRGPAERFIAKGRIEAVGPDLFASAHSENTYKALDLLMEALDALLRTRHTLRQDPAENTGLGDALPNA